MKPLLAALILFHCVFFEVKAQTENDIQSKINLQKKDNFIVLRAQVENEGILFKEELSYNFIALKKGKEGNYSNNKQSGEFSLSPNENKELAEIRINLGNEEELRSYLFIKYKDKLVSKDSIWISKKGKVQEKKEVNPESGFFLKGIVIDEAITKIGKDFHDYFYQAYLLSGRKHPFIIKIKEKPGMARSTILSIEVEDYKIHEFFTRPDEEYLKRNVRIVLQRVNAYAKKRSTSRNTSKI